MIGCLTDSNQSYTGENVIMVRHKVKTCICCAFEKYARAATKKTTSMTCAKNQIDLVSIAPFADRVKKAWPPAMRSLVVAHIMKTSPCNEDPLTPHIYIVKLGFTGVYIIFLFCFKTLIVGTR